MESGDRLGAGVEAADARESSRRRRVVGEVRDRDEAISGADREDDLRQVGCERHDAPGIRRRGTRPLAGAG
jgi:hypothetical protein